MTENRGHSGQKSRLLDCYSVCSAMVSKMETKCFRLGNKLFPTEKQSVSTVETKVKHFPATAYCAAIDS